MALGVELSRCKLSHIIGYLSRGIGNDEQLSLLELYRLVLTFCLRLMPKTRECDNSAHVILSLHLDLTP